MSSSLKKILPHVLVVLFFSAASVAYFSPVLQGKKIFQSDIMHYIGMAQQQKEYAVANGEETYWTNSAFGGMPTYMLGAKYPHNYIKKLDLTLRFLPRPADYLFLYFIGFYILLLSLKVDYKLSALGALAFGFSTYLIIILGVGHNSKAHAIAYMPLVLSGIILTFRKKYILGFVVTTIAAALEIVANHPQMTYYLLLIIIILGISYLIDAYKKNNLPDFFKSVGVLVIAAVLSIGLNATTLIANQDYVKHSTRGKSAITIKPDGSEMQITSGLSKDYITQYSYGWWESFNLFIPKFMGGGNTENVGKDSEIYKAYLGFGASPIEALDLSKNAPTYWGDQPIVEAPAYVGAVILFLFVLSLFLVKGKSKWWLLTASILALLLSYGKNFGWLTNLFIDYFPLYDKFRAVSSMQIILELCVPVLAILGLIKLFDASITKEVKFNALKKSILICAVICVLFLVFKSVLFDFVSFRDDGIPKELLDALVLDRKALFVSDTTRTLIYVCLSAALLYFYLNEKINKNITILALGVLIVSDLVFIDRDYVNSENFTSAKNVDKPFRLNNADKEILNDKGHFRVLDRTQAERRQPSRGAYYHNTLNGYHAAKLGRIDDLLEFYIYDNNINILNMFNVKYVVAENEGEIFSYENTDANGNAWFVKSLHNVANANEEILKLRTLKNKEEAISSEAIKTRTFIVDSSSSIRLKEFKPNYLKYTSNNKHQGFAVFSEVYYKNGWNAYINGELTEHQRVNYALRGLTIPEGEHTIEFKFEPTLVSTGSSITLASSILVGLLIISALFFEIKKKKNPKPIGA